MPAKKPRYIKAPGKDRPLPPRLYVDTETFSIETGQAKSTGEHLFRCAVGLYVEENINARMLGSIPPILSEHNWFTIDQAWEGITRIANDAMHKNRTKHRNGKYSSPFKYGGTPCDLLVIAHNMDYDQLALHSNGHGDFRPPGLKLRLDHSFVALRGIHGPYLMTYENEETGSIIVFADTANYYRGVSVEKMGEMLGNAKEEMPEEKGATLEDWVEYCRQDVSIICEAMEKLIGQFFQSTGRINLGVSASQTADIIYRSRYMEKDSIRHFPTEAENLAALGGSTESFYRGTPTEEHGKLYKIDRNSMYPAEAVGPMPAKIIKTTPFNKQEVSRQIFKGDSIWLVDATVNVPEGRECVSVIHEGKLVAPVGSFRRHFWDVELALVSELGGTFEIHSGYGYHGKNTHRSYMLDMYENKEKATDTIERNYWKLLLNAAMGKMNTRQKPKAIPADAEEVEWWTGEKEMNKGHGRISSPEPLSRAGISKSDLDLPEDVAYVSIKTYWIQHDNGQLYKIPDIDDITATTAGGDKFKTKTGKYAFNAHPGIYGFNTARARVCLWRTIHALRDAGAAVFYADTDSVVTDEAGLHWFEVNGMIGKELGQWKVEEESRPEDCEFLAPKAYKFNNKRIEKGRIKNSVKPMDEVGGLKPRPSKFRSMTLQQKPLRTKWAETKHTPSGENTKRHCPTEQGWTMPLKLVALPV